MIAEARQFLYVEDQYFWSRHIAELIHDALFEGRIEFVMLLLPKRLEIVVRRAGRYSFEDVHRAPFPAPPLRRSLEDLTDGIRRHVARRHARR